MRGAKNNKHVISQFNRTAKRGQAAGGVEKGSGDYYSKMKVSCISGFYFC